MAFDPFGSFTKGVEWRDGLEARSKARENAPKIAEASRLASGGDQAALGTLWSLDPDRAAAIGKQFRWADERGRAEKKMHLERLAGAAVRADTPEKWDAAVDLFAAQDPSLAMYRGQFAQRDSIIGGLAGVDGMLDEARDEQDFAEKVRQYEKTFGLQERQQAHTERLTLADLFIKQDDQRYRHMDGDRSHALKLDDFLLRRDGQAFDQEHSIAQFYAGREDRAFDEEANLRDYERLVGRDKSSDFFSTQNLARENRSADVRNVLAQEEMDFKRQEAQAKAAQGPAPLTDLGKMRADLQAGHISQAAYDAAEAKASQRPQLSEYQAKLRMFRTLSEGTEPLLQELELSLSNSDHWARVFGGSGRITNEFLRGPDTQRYNAASKQWLEGVLRLSTGAAATESEERRLNETYFPQPGDTYETLQTKIYLRQNFMRSLEAASNGDMRSQEQILRELEKYVRDLVKRARESGTTFGAGFTGGPGQVGAGGGSGGSGQTGAGGAAFESPQERSDIMRQGWGQ